jgi:chromosome segregation ATPase
MNSSIVPYNEIEMYKNQVKALQQELQKIKYEKGKEHEKCNEIILHHNTDEKYQEILRERVDTLERERDEYKRAHEGDIEKYNGFGIIIGNLRQENDALRKQIYALNEEKEMRLLKLDKDPKNPPKKKYKEISIEPEPFHKSFMTALDEFERLEIELKSAEIQPGGDENGEDRPISNAEINRLYYDWVDLSNEKEQNTETIQNYEEEIESLKNKVEENFLELKLRNDEIVKLNEQIEQNNKDYDELKERVHKLEYDNLQLQCDKLKTDDENITLKYKLDGATGSFLGWLLYKDEDLI